VSQKNKNTHDFYHNLSKCRPIFKILLPIDSHRNFLRNYYKVFQLTLTVTVLLHYLAKFKILK